MKHRLFAFFKKALALSIPFLFFYSTKAQVPNANSFSSQVNYTGNYRYGVNQGYYPGWSAENTATIAAGSSAVNVKGVGVKSFRVPLYDDFLTQWGLTVEVGKFQAYAQLGADDNTAFVGSPDASHRDPTTYPGSPEQSKTFNNLYEPIWLDAAQTQINPNNYYAKYLYDVVSTYGPYIKFWEVVNEPDFTYSSAGWLGDQTPLPPGSWFDHNPTPDELVNLRAPIFSYIRMLRISWEVIKKLQPNDFVCLGGIGYRSFLDAILRNTDNPSDGSVNSSYPGKGGAYFDVISYHCYPMYNVTVGNRQSDAAAASYIAAKNAMDALAANYGYNGSQYPKKQFICTETGVSRIMSGTNWGSNDGQRNYIMKASVLSQKNSVRQVYWFSLGDGTDATNQYQQMGLYYYFGGNSPYNETASDQGKALKTTSDLLYGKTYDASRTASLSLPSSVEGAAFRALDGSYTYVLWAKTTGDLSEYANATYSFPNTVIASANIVRKEWDFSETNSASTISKTNISLSGSPSFFTDASVGSTSGNQGPIANAGSDQAITLPTNSATLNGSGSDPDGNVTSYAW
ncbi:MAG: PKD domain-containing protein, partial [Flavisolibacter sp.]